MEEKNNKNLKRSSKNKLNQKSKKIYKVESKKKYISQNPLLSSKNNDSTKDSLKLKKYNKPFKNSNSKNKEKTDISDKECININKDTINNNNQKKYSQIKEDKNDNNNNENILKNNKNNEKLSACGCGSICTDRHVMKEDEEIVTSFERKPSEIHSPNTISEDSFITEISNYSNKNNDLNEKNNHNNENKDEDIVNYNNNDGLNCLDKGTNRQNHIQKVNEEKPVLINSKKFNKNESNKKIKILYNNNKIQSCKKIIPDKYYKEKIDAVSKFDFNEKSKNRKEITNKNQTIKKLNNNELKEKSYLLINNYSDKKNKSKKTKINIDHNEKYNNVNETNINIRKYDYDYDNNYLNSTINKNSTRVKFDLDFDKKNSILNNSNIYIPVNQRKKLESNRKSKNKDDYIESPKNINKKNNKKSYLFNSTELNFNQKQNKQTQDFDNLIKNKTDKNNSNVPKKNNNESTEIIPKNILKDFNEDEKNEKKFNEKIYNKSTNTNTNANINTNTNTNNNNNIKNKSNMKYNKNNVVRKSYITKNDNKMDKNISFVDIKLDKLNITNINFFKNKNKNNKNTLTKKNNKLYLSIDELNDIQKSSEICKIFNDKNKMVYAPKKPSIIKSKSKNKKDFVYNRASYDPNQSNYNNLRKKNFTKQQTITVDFINNNYGKRHTRNYSGVNNTTIFDMNNKNKEYIPNKYNSINDYIFNNNSHSVNRNSINMKIINSLNRSYDSNFYPNLNKFNYNNQIMVNKNLNNNSISNIHKTPNKYSLKTNSYLNNTMGENDKRKYNIYANNINNINNFLDIENPIVRYNIRTNKDYNHSQNNNINIINSNNNKNNLIKERLTFIPQQKNINIEIGNQYNRLNNLNIHNYQNQSNLINFYNNGLCEDNKIQNLTQSVNINRSNNYSLDFNLNLYNYLNSQHKIKSLSLNLEDLILLLEKFNNIIINFNDPKYERIVYNECFEFWNYYYNCSAYCQLEKLFINNLDSNAIRISINYCLISIMILYDYSFEIKSLKNDYNVINNILKLNYMNLMLISEHTLKIVTSSKSQINNNSSMYNNFLILKLYNIIDIFRKKGGFQNDYFDMKPFLLVNDLEMSNVEKISYNTNLIIQYLRYVLKNNKTSRNEILTSFFKKIKEKTYEEINNFFRENIFRIINKSGSILSSVLMNNKQINNMNNSNNYNKFYFKTMPSPYIRTKNNKNYSLVLDLDENLIHFKPGVNNQDGVVRIRPGVTEFLEEVGKYYELIIFTIATQEYADLLIDAVEEDKIYFDHRLYREHAIIIDNEFVKDLTRIGRPLDKIIIIDDKPQHFKLQKENGIIIKPFWGEDNYDRALFNLIPILKNIAKEGGDVRIRLLNYKNKIFNNITSVQNV